MVLRTADGYRTVECTGQGIGCWVLQDRLDDHIIKGVVIRRLQVRRGARRGWMDELGSYGRAGGKCLLQRVMIGQQREESRCAGSITVC